MRRCLNARAEVRWGVGEPHATRPPPNRPTGELNIRRVVDAKGFLQFDLLGLDLFLDPQVGSGEVPDLAKPRPFAHDSGGCCIGEESKLEILANVLQ